MNEQQIQYIKLQLLHSSEFHKTIYVFLGAIYQNLSQSHYPLDILHKNSVHVAMGGDVLSILGFMERTSEIKLV